MKTEVKNYMSALEADRKKEADKLIEMLTALTKKQPKLWGKTSKMIGFGKYHYTYPTGTEGEYFQIGFAPRASKITIYLMDGVAQHQDLLDKLGKYKTGVSCLYLKRLTDINLDVLEEILNESYAVMNTRRETDYGKFVPISDN